MKFSQLIAVNRTERNKKFSKKIMQKMRQGGQFETSFCFQKKASYEVKPSGVQLNSNLF